MGKEKNNKKQAANGKAENGKSAGSASGGGSRSTMVVAVLILMVAVGVAVFLKVQPQAGNDGAESEHRSSDDRSSHDDVSTKQKKQEKESSTSKAHTPGPVDGSLSWSPKTLSVVLPCAGEGEYAKKTVESVAKSVPGGIGGGILEEIIVVDDGSSPPLSKKYLGEKFQKKFPFKLVRHDVAVGLMGAKSAGANVAVGDIIVFFDCHVAPQSGWYKEFLTTSAENYKRIVVPVITDLDIDTWTERTRSTGMAKCYLTWDADFKWIDTKTPHMPVLSGGLLGISRKWWNETGGYDDGMSGWGGENVDQSLRSWLCGGEIVSMPRAFVAHMWRRPEDPRTDQNYRADPMDSIKNKARAVLGWFDEYVEKAGEYQAMQYVGLGKNQVASVEMNTDVSNFEEIRNRLKCRPFAWFLWRFRSIYVDGGLLPDETFQLQDGKSGNCLTYLGPMGTHPQGHAHAALLPCNNSGLPSHMHPDAQRWQLRNKNPQTDKCCSAIGTWNTDQCLAAVDPKSGLLASAVCDVSGRQRQPWVLTTATNPGGEVAPGQIYNMGKCLQADKKAQPVRMGPQMSSPQFKFGKCKKTGSGPWQKVAIQVPIETSLYLEAMRNKPELFTDT